MAKYTNKEDYEKWKGQKAPLSQDGRLCEIKVHLHNFTISIH